jgi:hypothetical protein
MKYVVLIKTIALLKLVAAFSHALADGMFQLITTNDNFDVISGKINAILSEKLDKIAEESPSGEDDITRSPDYVRIQDTILSCVCALEVLIVGAVFLVLKHFNLSGEMFLIVMYAIASFGTIYFMKHCKIALIVAENCMNATKALNHDITNDPEKNDEQNETPNDEDQKQECNDQKQECKDS